MKDGWGGCRKRAVSNPSVLDFAQAGGFCPAVGVSGFHLGGGLGPLTREFGIGADSMLQATVVTVNGSAVVIANATSNSGLNFLLLSIWLF